MSEQRTTTGFLNLGKHTTFIDVSSEGFDIGLHDKGEDTLIVGGRHVRGKTSNIWYETWWFRTILAVSSAVIAGVILLLIRK